MNTYRWAYHKIKAWALWRVLGVRSPSVLIWGISHPVMFSAGDFRDHRYAGVDYSQQSDINAILRRAMGEAHR